MSNQVRKMFCDIASRYDLANDLLSLGVHRLWRSKALSLISNVPGYRMLDLCCGTGDFAFAAARQQKPPGSIVGLDIAEPMIDCAKKKHARSKATATNISFVVGDALALPFANNSFECVTVGFGVRNFDDPVLGLKEAHRVLKEGGTLLVLEFGEIESKLMSLFYTPYATYILPRLGGWVTGHSAAYQYLHQTSLSFPGGKSFLPLLEQAGLSNQKYRAFWGGIAYAYTSTKASTN